MATPRPAHEHSLARRRGRWTASVLAAAAVLTLGTHVGRAELVGAPSTVTEAGCDLAVTFEGPIAHVVETHRLAASGDAPTTASYSAPLPPEAIVHGLTVRVAGRDEAGVIVPVETLDNRTPASLGLAPDLGTLRVGQIDGAPMFEVRLYPVAARAVTGFTLRWSAPARYADGQLSLTLPPRGAGDNLGRCQVQLDARPATGIRGWSAVRAGGVWVGAGLRVRGKVAGAAASAALTIEARPTWVSDAPVLAAAHAPTPDGVAATLTLYLPDQPTRAAFAPGRLLFLVDTSRSVGEDGRRAAVEVIEALVRAAPPATPVEAVLFDRTARRAVGAWLAGNAGGLARITRAVREAPAASGTDLGEALSVASAALGDEAGRVVIITDGVLPTDQAERDLLGRFTVATGRVVVDVIVPLVEGAAPPERGALTGLADVYGGRLVAFPAGHPLPAGALADGLSVGRPLDDLELTADGEALDGVELPETLPAGSGVVLTTTLAHRPRHIALRARRGTATLTARAVALPSGAADFALAAVDRASGGAPTDTAGGAAPGATHVGRRGFVGDGAAMIVLDRTAPGGPERLALARRTGVLTYTPPPDAPVTEAPTAAVPHVRDPSLQRVGELPALTVKLALRDQLLPRLRVCYRGQVAVAPALGGELQIELEIARGEVMAVTLHGDHFPEAMIACVADAAYALATPTYALGGVPDTVFVIRKPFVFHAPAQPGDEPTVSLDDVLYPSTNPAGRPAVEVEPELPL